MAFLNPLLCFSVLFFFVFPKKDPETDADGDGEKEQEPMLPGRTRHTVTPALHGCTLEVKKGELVAIVGAVGSGKSR